MNASSKLKVTVLDMQPIDPATGGGRLRLMGLYHDMGQNLDVTYIGTYDWPGPGHRDHMLSNSLREIDIPLSPEHFSAAEILRTSTGGKTVIDSAFADLAYLSPEYVSKAQEYAAQADIVIFSHPWIFPLVHDCLSLEEQLIVYDSHNVEGLLRCSLLDDGAEGTKIVTSVVKQEFELCHVADLILACSHDDSDIFNRLYGINQAKIKIVPNGVFTRVLRPATLEQATSAKERYGLGNKPTAIFIGSAYMPNVEAARFIIDRLAPEFKNIWFVIAGGVGDELKKSDNQPASNVIITGFIDQKDMETWLQAADFAVNPMFSGSGTNIKMFDFMASGLPVVTTPTGARGIETEGNNCFSVCSKENFSRGVRLLAFDKNVRERNSRQGRILVERLYSWERISGNVGQLVQRYSDMKKHNRKPFFSVIVPSYERQQHLSRLMENLEQQEFRDFEVIVVDQSKEASIHSAHGYNVDLLYLKTDVKGAICARNTGAFFARGEVLAFTDDDCVPSRTWLKSARHAFDDKNTIGLEGLIKSDSRNDKYWRAVTNNGLEGIGFMTANLFIRTWVFNKLNGFDYSFDNPHFREDTDLGWRALSLGKIPFSKDACVYHPPHKRDTARESMPERNKFFIKDALLYRKHPRQFKKLLLAEGHYLNNREYAKYFLEGAKKYGVIIDQDILDLINSNSVHGM